VLTRYLFMVFGDGDEHYAQAHLAALTVLAYAPAPCEVVVATNSPARCAWLATHPLVRIVTLDEATLTRWRGASGFFWRVKLECIRSQLDPAQALVYLDSDTYARRDLGELVAALAQGAVLMHEPENQLSTSRRSGDRRLYRQLASRSWSGLAVDAQTRMWNAGVVAVGPGGRDLIERALALCDELCATIGNHSLNEQLALSLSLQATGRLAPARPWIDHYWGNKRDHLPAIHAQLGRFLLLGVTPQQAVLEARERPILLPLHVRRRRWEQWLGRVLHLH